MTSSPHLIFSHGLDSGPHSSKNQYLRPLAEALGCSTDAVDDRDCQNDPRERVMRLVDRIEACAAPPVLVGSSLGGFVSVAAAERVPVAGLWLMAPALFMEDRYQGAEAPVAARSEYAPKCGRICVVHGWNDDIIPWQHSLRFADQLNAELHLIDAGHRLASAMPDLASILNHYLSGLIHADQ